MRDIDSRIKDSWPDLPQCLKAVAVYPNDWAYEDLRSSYVSEATPALIVMAKKEKHVRATILYVAKVRQALKSHIPFSFRSGGHGLNGASVNHDGIVLDISQMNTIKVQDPKQGIVLIEAGARWGDVTKVLALNDLVISSANYGDVGVGGLATSGGIGYFVRLHGLTIDHILSVRLATADGSIRWVDKDHEAALFWAIRGGSSQVGLALAFVFQAKHLKDPNGDIKLPVIFQQVNYETADLPHFINKWGEQMRSAPRALTSFLMLSKKDSACVQINATNIWAGHLVEEAMKTLAVFQNTSEVKNYRTVLTSYINIVPTPHHALKGQLVASIHNVLVDKADESLGLAMEQVLQNDLCLVIELRSLGAKVNDTNPQDMAWSHRHQEAFLSLWLKAASLKKLNEALYPLQDLASGLYPAYTSFYNLPHAQLAWPGVTGERLKAIACEVDPDGLFDQGLNLRIQS